MYKHYNEGGGNKKPLNIVNIVCERSLSEATYSRICISKSMPYKDTFKGYLF